MGEQGNMPLIATGISKAFDSTKALTDVSTDFEEGKVHALVGENGAGKSTLFKILSGYVAMDRGEVSYAGRTFHPQRELERKSNRVVLVHQELNINMSIGIAENIYLDRLRKYAPLLGVIKQKNLNEDAQTILDDLDSGISVRTSIDSLDLGQLKIIQVAQALSKNPEVIFLDESTAYLNHAEIKALVRVVHKLRDKGLAIGFVSHHLDELEMIADRITILKDGCKVGECSIGQLSLSEIEALMVGRSQVFSFSEGARTRSDSAIFSARSIHLRKLVDDVSFDLHKGEILGFAGLKGAGGEAVLEMMIGDKKPGSGGMKLKGAVYAPIDPHDAYSRGISYLPASRQVEGLITDFSIKANVIMTKFPRRGIFVDDIAALAKTSGFISFFNIRTKDANVSCNSLSGGNMQKVALSKSLSPSPQILLLNNPTRGIDVSARFEIYEKIRVLVEEQGLTMVMVSEDLVELIGLSDRILVFNKGKISKEFLRGESPSENDILSNMI